MMMEIWMKMILFGCQIIDSLKNRIKNMYHLNSVKMRNEIGVISKKLIILLSISIFGVFAADFLVPPAPAKGYILDEVGVLDSAQKEQLEQAILSLETATHHQIGVAIVQSLQGRPLEELSLALARTW